MCWVLRPACKHGKQTFSHFFGVVLWTLYWAKNTRLLKWASTTGGFIEPEFHLKLKIRNTTTCFLNPQEEVRLKTTWGKTSWSHRAKTLALMRWKSASLGSLILVESFGVLTKLAQWKQGFTDSARRKEQKRKASAVACLSPCFTMFASHELSKCKFVAKTHNACHEFARKCHLKSKT